MRRARFGSDGGELLFDRRDDLPVDGVCKRVAVRFRCPPPKEVDADCAHHDRCQDQAGNCQANANSHDCWSLLLSIGGIPCGMRLSRAAIQESIRSGSRSGPARSAQLAWSIFGGAPLWPRSLVLMKFSNSMAPVSRMSAWQFPAPAFLQRAARSPQPIAARR